MPLWKIEVYEGNDDSSSSKVGYLNATTEDEAIKAATDAMGGAKRADISIVAKVVSTLPPLKVLWVPGNA